MIDFELIAPEGVNLECAARNDGCSVKAVHACGACGVYLCPNPKCFVERQVEYLEDRPRQNLCLSCARRT